MDGKDKERDLEAIKVVKNDREKLVKDNKIVKK